MKKFIAGMVVGFIASCGMGFAASGFDHNGIFWNKLTDPAKTGYISGYSDAVQVSIGKLDSLRYLGDLFHWRGSAKIIKQLSTELARTDISPDQAVKKLNSLYADPKYTELDLGQALQWIAAKIPDNPAVDDDSSTEQVKSAPVPAASVPVRQPARRSTK